MGNRRSLDSTAKNQKGGRRVIFAAFFSLLNGFAALSITIVDTGIFIPFQMQPHLLQRRQKIFGTIGCRADREKGTVWRIGAWAG